jgi:hypothetical protein
MTGDRRDDRQTVAVAGPGCSGKRELNHDALFGSTYAAFCMNAGKDRPCPSSEVDSVCCHLIVQLSGLPVSLAERAAASSGTHFQPVLLPALILDLVGSGRKDSCR